MNIFQDNSTKAVYQVTDNIIQYKKNGFTFVWDLVLEYKGSDYEYSYLCVRKYNKNLDCVEYGRGETQIQALKSMIKN